MSNYLQEKYIYLLSSRFRNFKKKNTNVFNVSCPICGDSKRHPRKARGYFIERDGNYNYFCHKCGVKKPFELFLKEQDQFLYSDYVREKLFKPKVEPIVIENNIPVFHDYGALDQLFSMDKVSDNDTLKQYIIDRKIPEEFHSKLYYCGKFKKFVNTLIPNKFDKKSLYYEEVRLIIPYFTEDKKMFGFTGRSIDPKNMIRYVNINLDSTKEFIFGLERLDKNKLIYVVEGPIDSLFLPNCIATSGGDMVASLSEFNKKNLIVVYDNEKKSIYTRKKIIRAIKNGYRVCVWPKSVIEKDINQMIISGYTKEEIQKIIDQYSYQGLEAEIRLSSVYR